MNRRTLLAAAGPLALLAACSTTAAVPAAVTAAITALQGIIADATAMIASGSLTPAQLADAQQQIAALNAQLAVLQASTTSTGLSGVLSTVTSILSNLGQDPPTILSVLALLSKPGAAPDTPLVALLRTHYSALKAAAS